jgi:hypothetical protein
MKKYLIVPIMLFFYLSINPALAYEYTAGLSVSLSEEYNDNLFLASSERESDFITHISPGINFSAKETTSEFSLTYVPTFMYYSSSDELNDTAHRFTGNGNFTVSQRLSLTIADTFVKSSETNAFFDIPDTGPITERVERSLHTIGGGLSYKLSEHLSYSLGLSYADADYKEPGFDEVKTYSGNMGLLYQWTGQTSLSVNARFYKYDYRPRSDASQQGYTLEVTHRFSPTLTSVIAAGANITKIDDTDETDTGFEGSISLAKTFQTGEAALLYRQSVISGIESGEPLRVQSVEVRILKNITNNFKASASASYNHYDSVSAGDVERDETRFSTDVSYKLTSWANMSLTYRYLDSDDKIGEDDYYNNVILLSFDLIYNRRL